MGKFGDRLTGRERHVKTKTEKGVMYLPAKEHRRLLASYQKLEGRRGTASASQPSEGADPAVTLIVDF